MAEVVLGLGTSHSPMLNLTIDQWPAAGERDIKATTDMWGFDGKPITYETLLANVSPTMAQELTQEKWQERYDAIQKGVARVAEALAEASPDVLVMIGADISGHFLVENMPTVCVYTDDTITGTTGSGEGAKKTDYPIASDLAKHLLGSLSEEKVDVVPARYLPDKEGLGISFAFAYQRILGSKPIPTVPITQSFFYPRDANASDSAYELGHAIKRGIASWGNDAKVAVIGIGGLSHFVINEELDRKFLKALQDKDTATLSSMLPGEGPNPGIPKTGKRPGFTNQNRAWVTAAGAAEELRMELIDYVPCYRSPAGTGCGMGFARWS